MASSDNAKSNQHVLKIHPAPLADLMSGAKTAEVRRNDRGFQVGDTVRLVEVNPETGNWTGAFDHFRTISHIQTGYGLPDGLCVLSYAQAEQQEAHCPSCDGTGDVHRPDGEWLGECPCAESQEAQGAQAANEQEALCEAIRVSAKEFGDEADEDGLQRDARGDFVHVEVRQLLRICQLYRAALATQPAAGEPVACPDKGPWVAGQTGNIVYIQSDDFEHDVSLNVTGDFIPGDKFRYAEELAVWMNTALSAPPAAAHGDEYEIWSAAQLAPGEGIEDGAKRIRVLIGNAAHGDEAVRKDAERYQALRNTPEIFIGVAEGDDMVFLKSPEQLDQLADNAAAAMRAQAGEGGEV